MKKITKITLLLVVLTMSFAFAKPSDPASNKPKPKDDVSIIFQNINGGEIGRCNFKKNDNLEKCKDFKQLERKFKAFSGCNWCIGKKCYSHDELLELNNKYTENVTVVVGQCMNEPPKVSFDIKFFGYDNTELAEVTIDAGETPAFPEDKKGLLDREASEEFVYTFKGWNPVVVAATKNATYKAVYDSTVKTFEVSFFDGRMLLKKDTVKYGTDLSSAFAPEKEGYDFVGWSVKQGDLAKVTENIKAYAKFEIKTFKVCYNTLGKNSCDTKKYGEKFVVQHPFSSKDSSCTGWMLNGEKYKPNFEWFGPFVVLPTETVNKDFNFEGVCHANYFMVRFYSDDVVVDSAKVAYGKDAKLSVVVPEKDGYRFDGWDKTKNDLKNVKADIKVNAKFVKTYNVCYYASASKFKESKLSGCFAFDENSTIVTPTVDKKLLETKGDKDSTCTAWTLDDKPVVFPFVPFKVKKDMTFKGVCHANFFDVDFMDGEEVLDHQRVAYGKNAKFPKNPEKEGYRFDGWDVKPFALNNIKADLKVNAKFTKTFKVCYSASASTFKDFCFDVEKNTNVNVMMPPVTMGIKDSSCVAWTLNDKPFVGFKAKADKNLNFKGVCHANFQEVRFFVDGEQYGKTQTVKHGTFAIKPIDPKKEGYRFDGWDKPFGFVTENLDINAKFVKTFNVCFEASASKFKESKFSGCFPFDTNSVVVTPPTDKYLFNTKGDADSSCVGWSLGGFPVVFPFVPFPVKKDLTFKGICHANFFDVDFMNGEEIFDHQRIAYGKNASFPKTEPVQEGYRFVLWKINPLELVNVQKNIKVDAKFVKTYKVCYKALGEEKCEEKDVGSVIEVKKYASNNDSTCTAWNLNGVEKKYNFKFGWGKNNFETVKEDLIFTGVCHANAFDVVFYNGEIVVDSQRVAYGKDAVEPTAPSKEGYTFTGWDSEFKNVISDLKVNALFEVNVEVCFNAGNQVSCDTVMKGSEVEIPEAPVSEEPSGYTCTGWTLNGEAFAEKVVKADSNITFEGVCRLNGSNVLFVAFDTVLVDSQHVDFGAAAIAPDSLVPEFPGYRFNDWDKDFTAVEADMIVNAIFDTMYTVSIKAIDNQEFQFMDTTYNAVKDTVFFKSISKGIEGLTYKVCDSIVINGVVVNDTTFPGDSLVIAGKTDIVAAKCHDASFMVTYRANQEVIGSEVVLYNLSAKALVEVPEFANKRFIGWDKVEKLKNIVSNITIDALYEDIDTVFVIAHATPIDTLVIAKGDHMDYTLKVLENTADSTFNGWKVNENSVAANVKIFVEGGMKIIADFGVPDAIHGARVNGFSVISMNKQVQIAGAKKGDVLTVLDLQGRVIMSKNVMNAVETVKLPTSGTYLVRVGYQTKQVTIR